MLMFGIFPSFSHNVSCNYVNAISVPSRPKALSFQPIVMVLSNLDILIWMQPIQPKNVASNSGCGLVV
jgi:hypothetical protein